MVHKIIQALIYSFGIVNIASGIRIHQYGLSSAGAIIQQVTPAYSSSEGLFWADNKLLYLNGCFEERQPKLCILHKDGRNNCTEIKGVEKVSSVYAVEKIKNKVILFADRKSILLNLNLAKNGDIINLTSEDINVIVQDAAYNLSGSASDRRRELWIGADTDENVFPINGVLYKSTKDFVVTKEYSDFKNVAGMDFCIYFRELFVADTKDKVVVKFDYNLRKGTIGNKEIVFNASDYSVFKGYPCTVKTTNDLKLWIAMCVDGVLLNYDYKKRQIIQAINIPASYPVSLEFDGDVLFVGTSEHDPQTSLNEPGAGAIFAISGTGTSGQSKQRLQMPKSLSRLNDLIGEDGEILTLADIERMANIDDNDEEEM